ncbi:hypothetical protein pb186bvf_008230 [Paramecium bursaria]
MDQNYEDLKYNPKEYEIDGEKVVIQEYKKDLNPDQNKRLFEFLKKVEKGLANEDGFEVAQKICSGWRQEAQDQLEK